MKKHLRVVCALLAIAALAAAVLLPSTPAEHLPGIGTPERFLLRVWDVSGPSGSSAWLRKACAAFEKACPGAQVYLRMVSPRQVLQEGAALPDVIVFSAGTFTAPEQFLLPLAGETALHPELLRSGCWQGAQYALPLCFSASVLAVDGALFPESVHTPAPTTLLGRPAPTDTPAPTAATEVSPWQRLSAQSLPVAACADASLFTLARLRESGPVLPLAQQANAEAAAESLIQGTAAAALLSTGALSRLEARISAGEVRPLRFLAPSELLAPEVLYGGVTANARAESGAFLRFLTTGDVQLLLARHALFTAREDLTLYPAGTLSLVEQAAARSLCPLSAFLSPEKTAAAAWQAWAGSLSLAEALSPLR